MMNVDIIDRLVDLAARTDNRRSEEEIDRALIDAIEEIERLREELKNVNVQFTLLKQEFNKVNNLAYWEERG